MTRRVAQSAYDIHFMEAGLPSHVFWEKAYLYIDADYVTDQKGSRYTFSEVIDKYLKEFLYGYIEKILYYHNKRKEEPSSIREGDIKTSVSLYVGN